MSNETQKTNIKKESEGISEIELEKKLEESLQLLKEDLLSFLNSIIDELPLEIKIIVKRFTDNRDSTILIYSIHDQPRKVFFNFSLNGSVNSYLRIFVSEVSPQGIDDPAYYDAGIELYAFVEGNRSHPDYVQEILRAQINSEVTIIFKTGKRPKIFKLKSGDYSGFDCPNNIEIMSHLDTFEKILFLAVSSKKKKKQ
jgi:hypothetical protein